MGRQLTSIRTFAQDYSVESAADSLVLTDTLNTPSWAKYATFYLNFTAMSGTSESVDWKLSYLNPVDGTTATDYPGSGITQVTAAGQVIIHVTPETADDDTGPIYYLNSPLPPKLKATTTLGTSSVQEVQTIDLADVEAADTYFITYDSVECAAAITHLGTAGDTALIQAKIDELTSATAHCVVSRTDANTFVVTFNHGFAPAGLLSITNATGFTPKGDAGYTAGVIQTTPDTPGDEVYAGTLSVVYHA